MKKLLPQLSPTAWRGAAIGVIAATLLLGIFSTLDLLRDNVVLGSAAAYFSVGALSYGNSKEAAITTDAVSAKPFLDDEKEAIDFTIELVDEKG